MAAIATFLQEHWQMTLMIAGYFFLAFVGAMPEPGDPRPLGEKIYSLFYDMMHLLANRLPARYNANVQSNPKT